MSKMQPQVAIHISRNDLDCVSGIVLILFRDGKIAGGTAGNAVQGYRGVRLVAKSRSPSCALRGHGPCRHGSHVSSESEGLRGVSCGPRKSCFLNSGSLTTTGLPSLSRTGTDPLRKRTRRRPSNSSKPMTSDNRRWVISNHLSNIGIVETCAVLRRRRKFAQMKNNRRVGDFRMSDVLIANSSKRRRQRNDTTISLL
jgi:hypothetical protein